MRRNVLPEPGACARMHPPGSFDARLLHRNLKPSIWWGLISLSCLGWMNILSPKMLLG